MFVLSAWCRLGYVGGGRAVSADEQMVTPVSAALHSLQVNAPGIWTRIAARGPWQWAVQELPDRMRAQVCSKGVQVCYVLETYHNPFINIFAFVLYIGASHLYHGTS